MSTEATRTTQHVVGMIDEVPEGEGREFTAGGRRIAVFRPRGGAPAAVDAACPHRQGPLADGLLGTGTVVCPLHNRRFALDTGECDMPGQCAVAVYPVQVDDEGLIVVTVPCP